MKISYLAQIDTSIESGVINKFIRQANYWKNKGCSVKAYFISGSEQLCKPLKDLNIEVSILPKKSNKQLFLESNKIINEIINDPSDIVYIRFSKYLPGMKDLVNKKKVIAEINTLTSQEFKKKSKRIVYMYSLLTEKGILNKTKGFVFLTDEIREKYRNLKKPGIVLGDGIYLDQYPSFSPTKPMVVKLVFMATNNMPWQGIDKIVFLAKQFPGFIFNIIGLNESQIGRLDQYYPNIIFHGYLSKKDYEPIIKESDIGIGTLALHRISMEQSSPLKVREYLAYGLPTIIGYDDVDFRGDYPFILKLPNEENNVINNLGLISDFVNKWKGKRVKRDLIKHIDSEIKEEKRFSFISSIIAQ